MAIWQQVLSSLCPINGNLTMAMFPAADLRLQKYLIE